MLKLDELRIFIATAEAGSFVGAADQLGVAPSVVSKAIKSLEDKLSATLFNRTTRRIGITAEGEWLLGQASETMEGLEAIRTHFHGDGQEPEGPLTVDAATPFALHVIAPLLGEFADRYPKVRLTLESNETISDLIAKRVDIAIRIGALKDSTLKARKIGATRRALYASPRYLAEQGTPASVEDLAGHKCLGFSTPKTLNIWPLSTESGEYPAITPHIGANSGETVKQLALCHNGIACLSDFTVTAELDRGELVPVLADRIAPNATPIYAVHYSQRAAARPVRAFLDFLKERARF